MSDASADTRIVYGVWCSWWDSIDRAGRLHHEGLPCCPNCGSVLYEVGSESEWWNNVARHEAAGHSGYRPFVEWLRGRCFAISRLDRLEGKTPLQIALVSYQALTGRTVAL